MKTLVIALFISAFLVSSIYCDQCTDAHAYADMSIKQLRTNFLDEQYSNMIEDFENIMKSAEFMQETCADNVEFAINGKQYLTCSMANVMLLEVLDNYVLEHGDIVSTLSQIVSLIPTIEGRICLDEWEVAAMHKQQDLGDEIWSDHDATDDYDYDRSDNYDDNFLVEDEEEEDTGDEVLSDSDEEIDETQDWDSDDDKIEFSSDISTDYDDEDESEDEEEDDVEFDDDDDRDEDEETIVMIQEINEEETLMVYVDLSDEVEVEEEAVLTQEIPVEETILTQEIPVLTKEDEEMIKIFVRMTNMGNMENEEFSFEGEEEAFISTENGEDALDNEDGSIFVYVDIDSALGVDGIVNAIFADQDDIEDDVGEMDIHQYWDDEDGDDY